jgi:putative colanic acid biosynthesis acetyltransferase WcaF
MEIEKPKVRLDQFDPRKNFTRGRSKLVEAAWYLVKCFIFMSPLPWPRKIKVWLLRKFGAKIGRGFSIQPRVAIHFPWKLEVGDHCWMGQRCEILNFERVFIEDHVALAHDVYIATGNHDYSDITMSYMNRPSRIGRGSWIATRVFIGPGVVIGEHCVLSAGSVVTKSVPPWSIAIGNPAKVIKKRSLKENK